MSTSTNEKRFPTHSKRHLELCEKSFGIMDDELELLRLFDDGNVDER